MSAPWWPGANRCGLRVTCGSRAIAALGDGRQPSGDVSRRAGYGSTTETGPIRDSLIKKGLIYAPRHGQIDFTAPFFGDFMRRNFPNPKNM
jgi:hypothetical protein